MMTTPPCAGKHVIFDSTDPRDHALARSLCASCPVIQECRQRLRETQETAVTNAGPTGTWAGVLFREKGGRVVRNAATLAAEDAAYSIEDATRAHTAWTHRGDRSEWAAAGERVYQRRRAARKRAA